MDVFLTGFIPGHTEKECRAAFADRFGIELTIHQLSNRRYKLGVKHGTFGGRIGTPESPIVPGWNKGMKIDEFMSPEKIENSKATRFKNGNRPHNWRPIGSEWTDDDGYVYVKVRDVPGAKRFGPNGNWKSRSRIVYEKHNGKLPDGHRIVHADRDPANDSPENLVAVSVHDYAVLAHESMPYFDRESLETCLAIVKLKRAAYKAGKE